MTRTKNAAIIVAAGSGARAGGGVPKQYRIVGGKPLLRWSMETLCSHPAIDHIVLVIADDQRKAARALVGEEVVLVTGGATRQESVYAGLSALTSEEYGVVLVHDAARMILNHELIDRLVEALDRHDAAIPVVPVVDTLTRGQGNIMAEAVDRADLFRVQTPQAFRFSALWAAHHHWNNQIEATDDAGMMRILGKDVALVPGDLMLEKITHEQDFDRMERLMGATTIPQVGTGFDVHRTEPGRPLYLCGVEIPSPFGLAGHSDADVAIHALVDALLGALAEGDIGMHFPPSDPQWRGAPSSRFLTFACERVHQRGGKIAHVDVTIICETPKIGPHRDRMRESLAQMLTIDIDKISVKATTTEGLGYTGRGEGIAAQASATILLPYS